MSKCKENFNKQEVREIVNALITMVVKFDRHSFWEGKSIDDKVDYLNALLTELGLPSSSIGMSWSSDVSCETANEKRPTELIRAYNAWCMQQR